MKHRASRPVILSMNPFESRATETAPRILAFPSREAKTEPARPETDSADELGEVRERLFRMIVANQWDRSHGNRAS